MIKELDGLPAGEIHLAIAQSELKTVGLMETKLKEHQIAIEQRLDTQDEKLDTMQQDLSALVGTDKVPGLVSRNTDLLQGLVDRHQMWHDQDMEFRSTITLSVAQLADRHEVVAEDVRSIKWLVATFSGLRKLGAGTAKAVKESKVLWRVSTFILTAWIAVVQIVHVVWPAFIAWLHRGKR
jgi:hypothetical protein